MDGAGLEDVHDDVIGGDGQAEGGWESDGLQEDYTEQEELLSLTGGLLSQCYFSIISARLQFAAPCCVASTCCCHCNTA